MNLIEKATIIHYHRHRLETYRSGTVKALGWRGEESQIKRFEVLASMGDLTGCSVLDVGCGYGDLKAYLDKRFSDLTYIGIDQMPEFISEAKDRYQEQPQTYLFQTDFTTTVFPQVDYVLASGALAYRSSDPNFYFDMICKMFEAATKGMAFNMLDAAWFQKDELLRGHDVEAVVAFCQTLSSNVTVMKGYLEDDFTVMMKRKET